MPEFITRSRRTEFQTRAEGDNMIIQGYFIVYNEPYFIDDYMEEVSPRALWTAAICPMYVR